MKDKTPEEIVNDYFAVVAEVAKLGAELVRDEVDLDYKTLDTAITKAEETYLHLRKSESSEAIESFKESHSNLKAFYTKVHELGKTRDELLSKIWAGGMHGAEFYLEQKLPEGYDPFHIHKGSLKAANESFNDKLKCLAGVKPSAEVRYVTEQLARLVDECNQDPAFQHPLKGDPEFRFYGEDAIRRCKGWGGFTKHYGYVWPIAYEMGKGSSSSQIHMEYDPRTKIFTLNFRQTTEDPEEAIRLFKKSVEKIAEGRK
jgi:hypothetical protein